MLAVGAGICPVIWRQAEWREACRVECDSLCSVSLSSLICSKWNRPFQGPAGQMGTIAVGDGGQAWPSEFRVALKRVFLCALSDRQHPDITEPLRPPHFGKWLWAGGWAGLARGWGEVWENCLPLPRLQLYWK